MSVLAAVASMFLVAAGEPTREADYYCIEVVDAQTGRGVPLVELRTVHAVSYYTDSNGIVAFHEPGLMGRTVFFHVKSHGYEFPKDGFGFRGKALEVAPGGRARLEIHRLNVAQRLYRVTGGGIYRDSLLVGHPVPLQHPVLDGLVLGQDSVFTLVYGGKLYWFWGDTARPGYPLGNFDMAAATSKLPGHGGLDPDAGVDLEYFVDQRGFARPMAPMPGKGPTWLDGFVVLRDDDGRDRLFAAYAKVRQTMEPYQRGLAVFDDSKQQFVKVAALPMDAPIYPHGHTFKQEVDGVEYVYFASPYPLVRVRATPDDYCRLSAYEAFTPLEPGSRLDDPRIDRMDDGRVRYAWKPDTPAVGPMEQEKLVKSGKLKRDEALLQLQDADTGKPVLAHRGTVYWNDYRQRWVMIACEQFGTSFLGEIWFAEADTPLGPWVYARKVVTHEKYSFYNPKQHPMFSKENGRIVFFEGTYTNTFSGNPEKTPRYDYNQIMYKLVLADPRLVLPVPIYRVADGEVSWGTSSQLGSRPGRREVAFFALDRPKPGTVAVRAVKGAGGHVVLETGDADRSPKSANTGALFWALPAETEDPPETAVPLYEYRGEDNTRCDYSTDTNRSVPGFSRSKRPLCLVWRNPSPEAFRLVFEH